MSTATPTPTAVTATVPADTVLPTVVTDLDNILPARVRRWVWEAAIVLGAIVFAASLVLVVVKSLGGTSVFGVPIDTVAGVFGLVLAALSVLARANMTNGPGVLAAIEELEPKLTTVVDEVEADAKEIVEKVEAVKDADPALADMLVDDLRKRAKDLNLAGYSKLKKADLITAIKAATAAAKKGA